MLDYHWTSAGGSVDRSNQWGNGGNLEVTQFISILHTYLWCCKLRTCVTSLPQFMNYFQQEEDILNLAILEKPYLELGKILPMLAFWIVSTDPVSVVNRYKPASTGGWACLACIKALNGGPLSLKRYQFNNCEEGSWRGSNGSVGGKKPQNLK